jgi:uncharacterized protein (TIGR00288 family)
MAGNASTANLAVFCDFENIAIGTRESNYDDFEIGKVIERLLLKGTIVVKKAYCDWEKYKEFKQPMHEAAFELIEIPHIRMTGKNSADIRMVVDALDLCYTKPHVDTFVILSGDSDFSPLVSKLRENDKTVIGVGVKNSTSNLLAANCDEFIFYDDLVRKEKRRGRVRKRVPATKSEDKKKIKVKKEEEKRCLDRRTRRRGNDLGVDGQADPQAAQAGIQRVLLRLPGICPDARGGGAPGIDRTRTRRTFGRLHREGSVP